MPVTTGTYDSIAEAQMMPRLIRLGPNLFGASFTLMKLLPASYILERADERGELGPDTVIVETTSGTFGLGLAMRAALLRRELILVSDPAIDANLYRRLTDLGARIEICKEPAEVGGFQEARLRRLAEIRAELPDTFCPEQYSNPDNPRSYAVVAEQLSRALTTVDCVVGPVGSGGSMCGTVRGLREHTADTLAIGVDSHRSVLFGQADGGAHCAAWATACGRPTSTTASSTRSTGAPPPRPSPTPVSCTPGTPSSKDPRAGPRTWSPGGGPSATPTGPAS